jgi:hypothetical protein
MICGSMTEIGLGLLGILLEVKLEIMALKEFHRPPIFLVAEDSRLIGWIMMVTFGYLVENMLVNQLCISVQVDLLIFRANE